MCIREIRRLRLPSLFDYLRRHRGGFQVVLAIPSLFCLIFAVIWLKTGDPSWEPWTVFMAAIVAIGQIIMTVAENAIPKAIRDMDTDGMKAVIVSSNYNSDWKKVQTSVSKNYLYKKDPNLKIVYSYNDEGAHNDDFREEWANQFPDPKAKSFSMMCIIEHQ